MVCNLDFITGHLVKTSIFINADRFYSRLNKAFIITIIIMYACMYGCIVARITG